MYSWISKKIKRKWKNCKKLTKRIEKSKRFALEWYLKHRLKISKKCKWFETNVRFLSNQTRSTRIFESKSILGIDA